MDWSEKNLCIKCNEGGNLLVCSENGCPLAIHIGCMGCPARFDGENHFYCPYCLYKRAVTESRQAREYALARKKALLNFMAGDMTSAGKQLEVNEGDEANGHNQSRVNEENVNIAMCGDDTDKVNGAEKEKVPEEKISNEKGIQDKGHDEATAASSDQNPSFKMHQHEEKILEVVSDSSDQDTVPLRKRIKRAPKRIKTKDVKSGVGSAKSKRVEESDKNNKQTSPTMISPRRSPRKPSGLRTEVQSGKKVPSIKLVNDTLVSGKRKRLPWSEEEEDALKAGVQKHLNGPKINVSWRGILDMGRKVFDGTRTPSDLKDKWRNMSEK